MHLTKKNSTLSLFARASKSSWIRLCGPGQLSAIEISIKTYAEKPKELVINSEKAVAKREEEEKQCDWIGVAQTTRVGVNIASLTSLCNGTPILLQAQCVTVEIWTQLVDWCRHSAIACGTQ
jgi:hypothetical protein